MGCGRIVNDQSKWSKDVNIKTLAFCLPLGLLTRGAGGAPHPVAQLPKNPPRSQGVDLATDSGRVAQYIKSNGLDFVARYYRTPGSRWPALTNNEARVLSS